MLTTTALLCGVATVALLAWRLHHCQARLTEIRDLLREIWTTLR